MKQKLINGRVLTPAGLQDGLAVVIENDRIIAVGPADETRRATRSTCRAAS